jgi:hypothetical protein
MREGIAPLVPTEVPCYTLLRTSTAVHPESGQGVFQGAASAFNMSTDSFVLDLGMTALLLLLAVKWIRRPERLCWLCLLALAVPFALVTASRAIFVAGSIGLILLPIAWRADWKTRSWFALYNLLMLAAFLGGRQLAALPGPHLDPDAINHAGWNVLLLAVGLVGAWRSREHGLVLFCIGPVALRLGAVFFPVAYHGLSLFQSLVPALCLATGMGVCWLSEWTCAISCRQWRPLICVLLVSIGMGGTLTHVLSQRGGSEEKWTQQLARTIARRCGANDLIVVLNDKDSVGRDFSRQLTCLARERGALIAWDGAIDRDKLPDGGHLVLALKLTGARHGFEAIPSLLAKAPQKWAFKTQARYSFIPKEPASKAIHCEIREWQAQ